MKKLEIKNKLINHIMKKGEKKTSEKILLNSFKKLQKDCLKKTEGVIKLALICSTPTFRLNKIKKRKKKRKIKEIPEYIKSNKAKASFAIRLILKSLKKKSCVFYLEFQKEILLNSQNKGNAVELKNDLQKQVFLNRRYLKSYRW